MKIAVKWFSLILSIALLLSLCLALAAFATGAAGILPAPSTSGEPMEEPDPPQDSGESTPPPTVPSDAIKGELPLDGSEQPTPPPDPAEEDPPPTAPSDPIESDPPQPEEPGGEAPPVKDTAATAEELLDWFYEHYKDGGTLYLTNDICLDDDSDLQGNIFNTRMTIETGEYSLIAVGEVTINGGLTIRGKGGEKGVLRAAEGGRLTIGGMTVEASEGCAVVQEEGSSLIVDKTSASTVIGEIHYAKTPFVSFWGVASQAMVIVEPGQSAADALPMQILATFALNGEYVVEMLPVTWNLSEHETEDQQRLRFKVTGESADAAYLSPPFYTVVYNDFPLTFTYVETGFRRGNYQISGGFTKPIERLPITVAQEYSFDNLIWQPYEELDVPDEACTFFFSIAEDDWDTQSNPELYIRLRWDDDGTEYYSNVLSFDADNLDEERDNGGNRGGGTDITDPPGEPEPDPTPPGDGGSDGDDSSDHTPPEDGGSDESDQPDLTPPGDGGSGGSDRPDPTPPENNGSGGNGKPVPPDGTGSGGSTKPDPTPALPPDPIPPSPIPDPAPEPTPPPTAPTEPLVEPPSAAPSEPPPAVPTGGPPQTAQRPEPSPPGPVEPETPIITPAPEPPAASDVSGAPPTPKEPAESVEAPAPAELYAAPEGPGVLPIAVGCAAVAVTIGAAGLYLHPNALKGLLKMLRKILPKK